MCHRSWVAESGDEHSNERLEFLGDAVLGWVIADLVYRPLRRPGRGCADRSPQERGQRRRARRGGAARSISAQHLLLGRGEDAAGGREQDVDPLATRSRRCSAPSTSTVGRSSVRARRTPVRAQARRCRRHARHARLQVGAPGASCPAPVVRRPSTGSARPGPTTTSSSSPRCSSTGELLGQGEGRSKKAAEQAAASAAYALVGPLAIGRLTADARTPRGRDGSSWPRAVRGRPARRPGRGRPRANGAAHLDARRSSTG